MGRGAITSSKGRGTWVPRTQRGMENASLSEVLRLAMASTHTRTLNRWPSARTSSVPGSSRWLQQRDNRLGPTPKRYQAPMVADGYQLGVH